MSSLGRLTKLWLGIGITMSCINFRLFSSYPWHCLNSYAPRCTRANELAADTKKPGNSIQTMVEQASRTPSLADARVLDLMREKSEFQQLAREFAIGMQKSNPTPSNDGTGGKSPQQRTSDVHTCPTKINPVLDELLPDSLVISWYGGQMVERQDNSVQAKSGLSKPWTRSNTNSRPVLHPLWQESAEVNRILQDYTNSAVLGWVKNMKEDKRYTTQMHPDVMMLGYHFAKKPVFSKGVNVELGVFEGGLSICIEKAVRDSNADAVSLHIDAWDLAVKQASLRFRELGLPTGGIMEANFRNLSVIAEVRKKLGGAPISLLVLDNDGLCHCDLKYFLQFTAPGTIVIVDDYLSNFAANNKVLVTQEAVKKFEDAGYLEVIGVYGYGSWVGRVKKAPDGVVHEFD